MKSCLGVFASMVCLVAVVGIGWPTPAAAEWMEVAKLTPNDGLTGDEFGFSVAYDGDIVAVGARMYNTGRAGAAYLFEANGAGGYTQIKKLVPGDAEAGDRVGNAVLVSGDFAFVSGNIAQVGSEAGAGAVWIFQKDAGGTDNWGQVAKLTANTPLSGANFGSSMAIDGNKLLVCAQSETYGGESKPGAAYLFENDGLGNWTQIQRLQPSDFDEKDYFGQSCGIDGDTLAIGAHGGGKAYVFQDNGTGTWVEKQILTVSGSYFMGTGTAISGDNVVVGAYRSVVNSLSNAGTAYVFGRDTGGSDNWGLDSSLAAGDPQEGGYYGVGTAIDGNCLMVGAQGADSNDGAVYVLEGDGAGTWSQVQKISTGATGEKLGGRVTLSGNLAVFGAAAGNAAYVYSVVPEPGTIGLVLTGLIALLGMVRRRDW